MNGASEEVIHELLAQFERTLRQGLISDKHLPDKAIVRIEYETSVAQYKINFKDEK